MTDNELSKLGHPEDEVLEGRIVDGSYGPMPDWTELIRQVDEQVRVNARRMYVAHDPAGPWHDIATAGVTYEYADDLSGWYDEIHNLDTVPITVETTFQDVSTELFDLLTGGFPPEPDPAPPVDVDHVKWPGPRAKQPPNLNWLIP